MLSGVIACFALEKNMHECNYNKSLLRQYYDDDDRWNAWEKPFVAVNVSIIVWKIKTDLPTDKQLSHLSTQLGNLMQRHYLFTFFLSSISFMIRWFLRPF